MVSFDMFDHMKLYACFTVPLKVTLFHTSCTLFHTSCTPLIKYMMTYVL